MTDAMNIPITRVGEWTLLRPGDDAAGVLLQRGDETLPKTYAPEDFPKELTEELYDPENITQLTMLANYCKLNDKFTPLISKTLVEFFLKRHPDGPTPELPAYDGEGKTLVFYAEAIIRGNPLYRITCACPLATGSRCHAEPA
ncbi:MAG: hypothetical protein LBB14_02435 [Puniceicoccales bacterium]|jgi:hypothetical protein|nr:hypothetical protein [Puniceicoccales bacterium]